MFKKDYLEYDEKFLAEVFVYLNSGKLYYDVELQNAVEVEEYEKVLAYAKAGVLRVVVGDNVSVPVVYGDDFAKVLNGEGELTTITLA